jgi:hypothetical protein
MFAIIQWTVDNLHNVVGLRSIDSPRKEESAYTVGERVLRKLQGELLEATIIMIHGLYLYCVHAYIYIFIYLFIIKK